MQSENELSANSPVPIKRIPLRGCSITEDDVQTILERLQECVRRQGEIEVNKYERPESHKIDQWESDKKDFIEKAHNVTTTVEGFDQSSIFAPDVTQVFSGSTPQPIANIYCTNSTAFRAETGRNPHNYFELRFDFRGSPILSGSNPTSEPTPNSSELYISGETIDWVSSIESSVVDILDRNKNNRKLFHGPWVYEVFLFIVGIPGAILTISIFSDIIGTIIQTTNPVILGGAFVWLFLLSLFAYRILFDYIKYQYPTIELLGRYNRPQKHRRVWMGIAGTLMLAGVAKLLFG